jgi:hypothetical protein
MAVQTRHSRRADRHACSRPTGGVGGRVREYRNTLHSAAFTLVAYVHLLGGDIGEPLELGPQDRPGFATGGDRLDVRQPGASAA